MAEPFDTRTGRVARKNPLTSILSDMGKLQPQAVENEELVLGALMLERDSIDIVKEILVPDSFYKDEHKEIYEAILSLYKADAPIDLLTVVTQLRSSGKLEIAGGPFYISELTNRVSSAANIEYHSRIVSQKYILRRLISVAANIQRDAYDEMSDVFDILESAESEIQKIGELNEDVKPEQHLVQVIKEITANAKKPKEAAKASAGIPSTYKGFDKDIGLFLRGTLNIIAARPGMGKCLSIGTKVIMYDGSLKKVEDIYPGDFLMGDDSTPRKVLSIASGQENMYWVRQNKGIDYRVNESHLLSLKRSRNGNGYMHGELKTLSIKEYLGTTQKFKTNYKGYKVAIDFPEKPLELEPYFLGLWLGDGTASGVNITKPDIEVQEYVREYAERLGLIFRIYTQPGKCPQYGIVKLRKNRYDKNFSLKDTLRSLNLINNKHVPQHYLINASENRLQLLAGLLDSDGHKDKYGGFEITMKDKPMMEQIKFLCDSLGFRTSFKQKETTMKRPDGSVYRCQVYRVRLFGDIEKIPTKIPRKQAIKSVHRRIDWRMTGIKVEFDKYDAYYGFEIDGNHRFLLEDCTVTHNTSLVLNILYRLAAIHKIPTMIFSFEMTNQQLVARILSPVLKVSAREIIQDELMSHQIQELEGKISVFEKYPMYLDDNSKYNILDLSKKIRKFVKLYGIEMVAVDYLQLIKPLMEDKKNRSINRDEELGKVSRTLKELAKELNIPIIGLSQLGRQVDARKDKRPLLSDLRETGNFEQDADHVSFIYRPEYYWIEEVEVFGTTIPSRGVALWIIGKDRFGLICELPLRFTGAYTSFEDWDGDQDMFANQEDQDLPF